MLRLRIPVEKKKASNDGDGQLSPPALTLSPTTRANKRGRCIENQTELPLFDGITIPPTGRSNDDDSPGDSHLRVVQVVEQVSQLTLSPPPIFLPRLPDLTHFETPSAKKCVLQDVSCDDGNLMVTTNKSTFLQSDNSSSILAAPPFSLRPRIPDVEIENFERTAAFSVPLQPKLVGDPPALSTPRNPTVFERQQSGYFEETTPTSPSKITEVQYLGTNFSPSRLPQMPVIHSSFADEDEISAGSADAGDLLERTPPIFSPGRPLKFRRVDTAAHLMLRHCCV